MTPRSSTSPALTPRTASWRTTPLGSAASSSATSCWSPATPPGRRSTSWPTTGPGAHCCSCPGWAAARLGRLRVQPGNASRELVEDLAADFVRDDLGVASLDAVDGQLCDVGRVGFGDIEVPGHVGFHVADVQRGDLGA